MRVAITGATGFVGQYVLRELQSRNLDIVATTRSTRPPISAHPGTRLVYLDISRPPPETLKQLGTPDVLIHLAWGGLPNYQSRHHVDNELPAHVAFLTSCIEANLRRLVVTGTCFEYGLACGELAEDVPTQPCTQYGIAKDSLHRALTDLHQRYPFELAWLRLFYLYGKGQSESSLYSMLHSAMERGDSAFDMSGGEQIRDFLPVHEAARLIVDVALMQGNTGTLNICSGAPVTVREIVQSWIAENDAEISINLGKIPYSRIEPMAFWGSREKTNTLLGLT